jgi:hypothetical protein
MIYGGDIMTKLFTLLSVIGIALLFYVAFTIPNNPYEIIPAISMMSFDKPLWLCIVIGGGFIYLVILWSIYDKITGNITKWCNESC